MDRRRLIRGGIALTGGLVMPATIDLTNDDSDPSILADAAEQVRAAFWEHGRGAGVLPEGDALGWRMLAAEQTARAAGNLSGADALARVTAEHAQSLSLMFLKSGRDDPAYWWGDQARTLGLKLGDADLTALGACRCAMVRKHTPSWALDILRHVRDTDMSPWARTMVELHLANAHAQGGKLEDVHAAELCFDRAEQALDAGDSPRPRWAGSLHHSWIESYHWPKAMVRHRPQVAEELLADALAATPSSNHVDRGAVQLRRADAAYRLDRLDDAAALGLSAADELRQAGADRDLARLRVLAGRLSERTDTPVARELADAVEG